MLPEARERAVLLTDVHTELHLDLTSTEDFGVEATISFGCTQPGASTFLELNGGTDVTLDGRKVDVKGPKGSLRHTVAEPIKVGTSDGGRRQTATRPGRSVTATR